ncbi:uncharacterized protein TNCV_470891 [Trichonephila clavipes]|nr:uncharacterized protein TNCV_470891 [Trichonephila clavipes]
MIMHHPKLQMFFYKDTSDAADRNFLKFEGTHTDAEKMTTLINKIKLNESYNEGFADRWELTKNGNLVKIWIPLKQFFGFFNDYRKIMSAIDVKFEFMRNEFTNNMIYTDVDNPDYKVKITNVSLLLPHIKLNPEAQAKYLKFALNPDSSQTIEWTAPRLRETNALNDINGTVHVKTTTDEIISIFVIPQYLDRENTADKNNMVFDPLDLTRCYIRVNDTMFPMLDYGVSFKEGELDYVRYYSDFLSAGGNTNSTERGCLVSYKEYSKLYPIIYFDVSNHPPYINAKNLNIEFTWYLRNNPGKPYKFYFILNEKRSGKMNMYNRKFENLPTL